MESLQSSFSPPSNLFTFMNCLFCSIIAGEIPSHKIFENDHTFVFLDIGPVSKGHTLVIPKAHAPHLTAGSVESAQELMATVHAIAPAIMKAVNADGYNLGMNEGECAGQIVMHTHLHIMPRWNGVERTFVRTHPSQEELAETAAAIRQALG